MKKRIYLQPVTVITEMALEADIALGLSKATGQGVGLEIGYGDEDDEEDVVVSTNHTRVWDEMD